MYGKPSKNNCFLHENFHFLPPQTHPNLPIFSPSHNNNNNHSEPPTQDNNSTTPLCLSVQSISSPYQTISFLYHSFMFILLKASLQRIPTNNKKNSIPHHSSCSPLFRRHIVRTIGGGLVGTVGFLCVWAYWISPALGNPENRMFCACRRFRCGCRAFRKCPYGYAYKKSAR